MSNWTGIARTNYVKVKDASALAEDIKGLPIVIMPHDTLANFVTFVPAIYGQNAFDHNFTSDEGEQISWTWREICQKHLCEGQVLVVLTIGRGRERDITGTGEAFDWRGSVPQTININSIYHLAGKAFGVSPKNISSLSHTVVLCPTVAK